MHLVLSRCTQALHLPDVKEKASKNSHTKEVRDKAKNTIIKKYGVDNVSKSDIIKQKKVETCLNNYGVKYFYRDALSFIEMHLAYAI